MVVHANQKRCGLTRGHLDKQCRDTDGLHQVELLIQYGVPSCDFTDMQCAHFEARWMTHQVQLCSNIGANARRWALRLL